MDTPIASRDEALSWLRLTLVPGVTLSAQHRLLRAFGTPARALEAPHAALAAVAGEENATLLARGPDRRLVERSLRWLEESGHALLTFHDAAYPDTLRNIPCPPTTLYLRGDPQWLSRPSIAIVGSRNATAQGLRDAHAFAAALSEAGLTVVSGLALGIDAAAHRGGLTARGSSVAVMGTGADIVYPRRNDSLAMEIAAKGCLVTEFPLGIASLPGNFPRRNRLISGLSKGVLVVEAALKSGSLITAQCACEQDREVFAIPASIHSPHSKGCHRLIKEGAKLVECAEDILEDLGWGASRSGAQPVLAEAPEADPILEAMGRSPVSIDQMAARTGLAAAKLAAHLSLLEIDGRVAALAGGWFQRLETRVIE